MPSGGQCSLGSSVTALSTPTFTDQHCWLEMDGNRIPGEQPLGIRVQFDNDLVDTIEVAGQEVGPDPTTMRSATAGFNSVDGKSRLTRYQYPITLAWAVTIHKVQGVSLDGAVIVLGNAMVDHGQADVALSRVRSFAGVLLVDLIMSKNDLKLAPDWLIRLQLKSIVAWQIILTQYDIQALMQTILSNGLCYQCAVHVKFFFFFKIA